MAGRGRAHVGPGSGRGGAGSGTGRARKAGPGGGATAARIRAVVDPVVTAAGYDLEDLTVTRAGRRSVVRMLVDSDRGVNLDDVAVLSRVISRALDEAEESGGELTAGEYTLEVSSPGVDRPLTLPRHWRRNVGRLVKVKVGPRQVTGRVVAADERAVELDLDGERLTAPYADLGPGRVQLDFSRVAEVSEDEIFDDEIADDRIDDGIAEDEIDNEEGADEK